MGALASKEWAEVYSSRSPGSPDEGKTAAAAGKQRSRLAVVDPRSVSDDVERTPIRLDKASPNEAGGSRAPSNFDRLKRSLDPRSPSGLPRTPILVLDDGDGEEESEKKGRQRRPVDPSSAQSDKENGTMEEAPKRGSAAAAAPPPDPTGVRETVGGNEPALKANGKSLPRPFGSNLENDCRSPLLIESEDRKAVIPKFAFDDSNEAQSPLKDLNTSESAVQLLEDIHIDKGRKATVAAEEPLNTSLVI